MVIGLDYLKVKIYCKDCGKQINGTYQHEFKKVRLDPLKAQFNFVCPCGSDYFYLMGRDYTILEEF